MQSSSGDATFFLDNNFAIIDASTTPQSPVTIPEDHENKSLQHLLPEARQVIDDLEDQPEDTAATTVEASSSLTPSKKIEVQAFRVTSASIGYVVTIECGKNPAHTELCTTLTKDRADISGVITADRDLAIRATSITSGVEQLDGSDDSLLDSIHPEDTTAVQDAIEHTLSTGDTSQVRTRVEYSDGQFNLFSFTLYPQTHFESATQPLFTSVNITDQHFFRQRRTVINRILRHDLRNDMNVIIGNAKILKEECSCSSSEPANTIQRISERLVTLGDEVHTVDQELNRVDRRIRRVNLTETLNNTAESIHESHPAVEFRTSLADEPIAGNGLISTAIKQLLQNAVEHSDIPPSDLVISIETTYDQTTNTVTLTITDNGHGISESESRVVSKDRVETQADHLSGLGLWLVKWVADSVHAQFTIRPQKSESGTIATIKFKHGSYISENTDSQTQFIAPRERSTQATQFGQGTGISTNIPSSTRADD